MTRTTIDIDDALLAHVMRRYNLSTKREAVDFALRGLVTERIHRESTDPWQGFEDLEPLTVEEMLALEGSGWDWPEDLLDQLRGSRPEPKRPTTPTASS